MTLHGIWRGSAIREGGDTTFSSPGRSPKQSLPGKGLYGPYMVGKLASNLSHSTRGLVKCVPVGVIFVPFPPKMGTNLLNLRPLNR